MYDSKAAKQDSPIVFYNYLKSYFDPSKPRLLKKAVWGQKGLFRKFSPILFGVIQLKSHRLKLKF